MVQRYAHLSPGHQRNAIERLVTRQSGRDYKRIAKGNAVPADLVTLFGPP